MLIVIFGAGASFDSNPDRPVGMNPEFRPPLANQLFEMDRVATVEAARAFPRAAPALMEARKHVRSGGTIEGTLARLQESAEEDGTARTQLMAVRFYLQRVLTQVSDGWDALAVRQTSYVSMLDQLRRWQRSTHQDIGLITFNYDLLLERACDAAWGVRFEGLQAYQSHPGLRVYKPHGSVDWSRPAAWPSGGFGNPDDGRRAICDSPDLIVADEIQQRLPTQPAIEMEGGRYVAWLPALAIPVERKPELVMPSSHSQRMFSDLSQATALMAVGWRAREQHFLQLLQDHLPSGGVPAYVVSSDLESAMETVDNLWETGRFREYCAITGGFAAFADSEPDLAAPPGDQILLTDVLRRQAGMTRMQPGRGVGMATRNPTFTRTRTSYMPFA